MRIHFRRRSSTYITVKDFGGVLYFQCCFGFMGVSVNFYLKIDFRHSRDNERIVNSYTLGD